MAFRKRRRPKVVWLPVDRLNRLGIAPAAISTSTQPGWGIAVTAVTGPLGNATTEVFPIVLDKTPELALTTGTQSLADVEQSSYRLRRIVGKIFASIRQDVNAVNPQPVHSLLTIGFIVLRINEEDSQPLQNAAQYDAQSYGNIADPWIWRRSWLLTNLDGFNNQPAADASKNFFGVPSTNSGPGSQADGPHIDAKTARVIGPEERLFMVVTNMAIDGVDQTSSIVTVLWDLRVLGSMRSSQGNRRNASR